jgi:uncharacterized protein (DUF58 family)
VYPTPRLALVVLVLSGIWLTPGVGGVAGVGALALIVVAVVVEYLRLPRRTAFDVERAAPSVAGLGDDVALRYTIRSRWMWPARVRVYDDLPAVFSGGASSDVLTFGALDEVVLDIPVVAQARGKFQLGRIALVVQTPLGLLRRIVRFEAGGEVVVVPSVANVRRFHLLAMHNRLSDAGVRALKQRGEGGALAGLRDYVPGDDPRLLDWKATARHSRPIVREQSIERSQSVLTLMDCGRGMTQLAGRYPRFEHALSAALVFSDVAAASGDRVGLLAFDDQVRAFVTPQRGAVALRAVRTAFSALEPTVTEPDYAAAFRLLALRQRRRALVVMFTDVIDVRAARSLVGYAGRAAQRHLLIVVAIQNEALLAAAEPATSGSLALFRSAAAEELIREREESLARMRHAGITVLDVGPAQMATALVNRYLEVKARGLL